MAWYSRNPAAGSFWKSSDPSSPIILPPDPSADPITFGAGGGTGGGSWPRLWQQQQPIEDLEALHLMGMI